LRAKRREALAQLDTLLQATFLDLFGDPVTNPKGWERASFSDVVYFQEGPGVRNWQFRDAGTKLINVRNIVDGELDLENTERHLDPQEVKDKYSHFLLDDGDLVMSSSGVTWGKIAYVRREHLPLCLNTSMIRLRPAERAIVHSFIKAFVQSESFRRQMLRLITGSAQPNFGPSHLRKLEIGLPPLDVQQRFESIVESIESQQTTHRAHLAELDTLFASLQSRAFRGEL
jgi:type I restriction enzyme S subunit